MFDPTLHIGDIIALGTMGAVAWQRVSSALHNISTFMEESRHDRYDLRHRIENLEAQVRDLMKGSN